MSGTYHGPEGVRQAVEEGRRNLRGCDTSTRDELIDAGRFA